MDSEALAGLGDERLDWRFKSVPTSLFGLTVAEAAARRPGLFRDGFVGPIVALDGPALDHNLTTMAAWCADRGVLLAPHGKTTMAPALFARQIEHGAWAITAANAGQLRVYRAFGVSRVLLANEFLDPAGLRWLADEFADPGFDFTCWVDSVRGVELMAHGWAGSRPIDVLVEIGMAGGRTGARDLATARAVAEAIVASPALRLAGFGGYEGPASTDVSAEGLNAVADYLARFRTIAVELSGLVETAQMIVTAGGSSFFDLVADTLTQPWPRPALPILRCGTYVTHDDGFYRATSPLGGQPRVTGFEPFRSALRAWAQVISCPEPGLALLAVGKRDVPYDFGLPEPQVVRTATGIRPLTGCTVAALQDQHAYLRGDADLQVGDWVGLGLSHPCATFDKWSLLPVTDTDGETVVDFVRTFF